MTHSDTEALTILNTRPLPMGAKLAEQLNQLGFQSLNYPQITTEPLVPENLSEIDQQLTESKRVWIFVSRTAVRHFFDALPQLSDFIPEGEIIAVGPGTKQELLSRFPRLQINLPLAPNSESLIQMPLLNAAKYVSLVKGVGGRELIENTLIERGLNVVNFEVYSRINQVYSVTDLKSWQQADILLATSVDIAKALFENSKRLPRTECGEFFQNKRWLVLSERIKQYLLTKGMPSDAIFICEDADNSSIIKTIKSIVK